MDGFASGILAETLELNVSDCLRIFKVYRTTYYNWKNSTQKEGGRKFELEREDILIKLKFIEIIEDVGYVPGARGFHTFMIRDHQMHVSIERCLRIMNVMNLSPRYGRPPVKKAKKKDGTHCHPCAAVENLVCQAFYRTNGHIRRMIAINGFLAFLKIRQPATYMIPEGLIGQYKHFTPYLYSDEELASFFFAADTLPVHPVALNRELISPVIFRMLYCCGLRPQEPLKIKCTDIDYQAGTLYIADSKVHKDRIVSMSDDMRDLCVKYNDTMDYRMPCREYFFQRPDGNPYSVLWLQRTFRACIRHSGLLFNGQHPRVYDWRHNFATRIIRKWLQEGLDVASNLPRLSTYMGHTSLEDTAYYIHLVPEHLEEHHMNEWSCIPEVPSYED